jgi:hypothetical protein
MTRSSSNRKCRLRINQKRQVESTPRKHGARHKGKRIPALQDNPTEPNRLTHLAAAQNQNQDAVLHKQSPRLHLHAQCRTSGEGSGAPQIQPEPVRAVWRPAAAVSMRERKLLGLKFRTWEGVTTRLINNR